MTFTDISDPDQLIDSDANPYVPKHASIAYHRSEGQLLWRPDTVSLWRSDAQLTSSLAVGETLLTSLDEQRTLNASVLAHLLDRPSLIPISWRDKFVFFWSTRYKNADGYMFVPYIFWNGQSWSRSVEWLGHLWDSDNYAALLTS